MLQAFDVSKTVGSKKLFTNLSFSLQEGQKLALVGRNGTGKSSLMQLLVGELAPDSGHVRLAKGTKVGYLNQHRHFKCATVLEEVTAALAESYHGLSYRAEQILQGLGMDSSFFERPIDQLSGGQRLRLGMAVLLAEEPDLLFLDEPTNHLDLPSILWLGNFLKSYKGSAVIISHDRGFLDTVCNVTAGLHMGKFFLVEGSTSLYYQHLLALEKSQNSLKEKIDRHIEKQQQFINRFRAKATKAAQVKSREKQVAKLPSIEEWAVACNIDMELKAMDRPLDTYVRLEALEFRYEILNPLIGPLDLEWGGVERLSFVGANGQGKSTLIKLITGELQPLSGQVIRKPSGQIGYFGQQAIEKLDGNQTPLESLMELREHNRSITEAICRKGLGSFGIEGDMQTRPIKTLSGGERARVVLTKISLRPTHGLILDEPTHHLDLETIESLMAALEVYQGCVILVTHSASTLKSFNPDKILVFDKGEQIWSKQTIQEWLKEQTEAGFPSKNLTKTKNKRAAEQQEGKPDAQYEREKELTRALRNQEKKIATLELAIKKYQENLLDMENELAKAHEEGQIELARQMAKSLEELKTKIDETMNQWYLSSEELEKFQESLSALRKY